MCFFTTETCMPFSDHESELELVKLKETLK